MNKKRFYKNIAIYSFLIIGYVLLYVVDIKGLINPTKEKQPKAKVEFIYQQF